MPLKLLLLSRLSAWLVVIHCSRCRHGGGGGGGSSISSSSSSSSNTKVVVVVVAEPLNPKTCKGSRSASDRPDR